MDKCPYPQSSAFLDLLPNTSPLQDMATITQARPPRVFPRWLVNARRNDYRGYP